MEKILSYVQSISVCACHLFSSHHAPLGRTRLHLLAHLSTCTIRWTLLLSVPESMTSSGWTSSCPQHLLTGHMLPQPLWWLSTELTSISCTGEYRKSDSVPKLSMKIFLCLIMQTLLLWSHTAQEVKMVHPVWLEKRNPLVLPPVLCHGHFHLGSNCKSQPGNLDHSSTKWWTEDLSCTEIVKQSLGLLV